MEIVTKEYDESYKSQIFELFSKTFKRELSADVWNWRFETNPFGKSLILLAFFKEKLVAQCILQPLNLESNSDRIKALFAMTTMTDPNFSGKGIMSNLASQALEIGKKYDYELVFGFANKNARYLWKNKLEWKELNVMEELGTEVLIRSDSKYTCSKILKFDESFTTFYDLMSKKISKIMIPRTMEYLNWRFIDHPDIKYHCYKITYFGKFYGYFVLKNYNGVKCHIIDFLLSNDSECFSSMINQAVSFCAENKIKKLTIWCNKIIPLYNYLLELGFREEKMETYFVIKRLNSRNIHVETFDNWYITMSDSDVF